MQCVSQLVRDSREFSTLLGRMEPGTGVRRPGAIDKVRIFLLIKISHKPFSSLVIRRKLF